MFPLHKLRSEESSVLALGERFIDCGPGSDGVGVFGGGGMPPPEPRCLPPRCSTLPTVLQHYSAVES